MQDVDTHDQVNIKPIIGHQSTTSTYTMNRCMSQNLNLVPNIYELWKLLFKDAKNIRLVPTTRMYVHVTADITTI